MLPHLCSSGDTVFILGGGPSLLDEDLSPIQDRFVIGVNNAFKLGPWVDVCWFGDCRWYGWNSEALSQYSGLILSCSRCSCNHPKVVRIPRTEHFGILTNPERVAWNKSSGGSDINLAYHLGARRIVLLGYDMKPRESQNNWHNDHKHVPRPTIYQDSFLPPFERIAFHAKQLGVEIINATPDSALTVFPTSTLTEVLRGC